MSSGHETHAAAVADAVIALSDGLALRMLYAPQEPEHLLTALDQALDALIPARGTARHLREWTGDLVIPHEVKNACARCQKAVVVLFSSIRISL